MLREWVLHSTGCGQTISHHPEDPHSHQFDQVEANMTKRDLVLRMKDSPKMMLEIFCFALCELPETPVWTHDGSEFIGSSKARYMKLGRRLKKTSTCLKQSTGISLEPSTWLKKMAHSSSSTSLAPRCFRMNDETQCSQSQVDHFNQT